MSLFLVLVLTFLVIRLWRLLGTQEGFQPRKTEKKQEDLMFFSGSSFGSEIQGAEGELTRLYEAPQLPDVAPEVNKVALEAILKKRFISKDIPSLLGRFEEVFKQVIEAYAAAHHRTLKDVLVEQVYESFAQQIEKREAKGLTLTVEICDLKAHLKSFKAAEIDVDFVVQFTSEQMFQTSNADGESFDNPAKLFVPKTENWTFRYRTRARKFIILATQ